jgi:hypothetical protein
MREIYSTCEVATFCTTEVVENYGLVSYIIDYKHRPQTKEGRSNGNND